MHVLSTLCSDNLPAPLFDYLDPTPACDGCFLTEASVPCVISKRDHDDDQHDSPCSFLLYSITPPLTRSIFESCYVKLEEDGDDDDDESYSGLDQVIQTIRNIVHTEWKECVNGKVLLYMIIAETLCAWLSAKRLWYVYSPINERSFKYSMPKYLFRLPPNCSAVTNKKEDDTKMALKSMTLYEACQKVYVAVTQKQSEQLKPLLTRNFRATLQHMRIKEISLDERGVFPRHKKTRYHVHGANMRVYVNRSDSPTSHENTFYSHLTLSPHTGIFHQQQKRGCSIKQCASMVIPYNVLCEYIKTITPPSSSNKKRKHGDENGEDKELKRLRDEFHSDCIVYYKYTSVIKKGALCVASISKPWDLTPLGIDESYWNWIKQTDSVTSTYADPDTHRLRSGPRLVSAPSSTEECCIPMSHHIISRNDDDAKPWYLHFSLEVYAGIFIAPLIHHELFHHHHNDTTDCNAECIISCHEALSLLCATMSEVYKCVIALFPDLELSTLQEHYKEVKKQRLEILPPAAQQWLSAPSSEDASVLYNAAQSILDEDHKPPTEESIKSARRRLCLNLAYGDNDAIYRDNHSITIDEGVTFNNTDSFLIYCMHLIERNLLFPLVRCWSYIHPPVFVVASHSTDTRSYILTQIHNSLTSHTQDASFESAIDMMLSNPDQSAERLHACEFDRDMLSLILIALRYNSPTSDALITKVETLLANADSAGDTHVNTMLDTARKEIKGMLTHRLVVDQRVIIDIARQMSRLNPLLDQRLYISGWLLETVRDDPVKYTPAMLAFKAHVEKNEHDALLLGIVSRIKQKN